MLERRSLGEGTQGAQERDVHRLFQGQAGRHDFPEQAGHLFRRQRPRVLLLDAAQNLGFPLRTVEEHILPRIGCHLHVSHFLGAFGAGADQLHDLLIKAVYFIPQLTQTGLLVRHDQPRSFANSAM